MHDQLRKIAGRVVVAHPGQLRLIFRSKRKNDRVDAKKLAKLLFLDQVPTVYVPSVDVRTWRRMIEFRNQRIATARLLVRVMHSMLRTGETCRWSVAVAENKHVVRTAEIELRYGRNGIPGRTPRCAPGAMPKTPSG